jgi:hypothetical protein
VFVKQIIPTAQENNSIYIKQDAFTIEAMWGPNMKMKINVKGG